MSDQASNPTPPGGGSLEVGLEGKGSANLVYILYLVGFLVGITSIIGVVLAYVNRGKDPMLDTHYTFQIRTFWIGLLGGLIAAVTSVIIVGWAIMLVLLVWAVMRIITGMQKLSKNQPVADPTTWGFKA
ncbi:DUF4870 family protein [Roseospirillum parvum]|uniref:Uncharacterized membrane protein n=1 Tax=Roseospirillum parvum TaxID=83401 RepID=A0A1G7WZ63_9PROT|nr:hypothetical protein [Roseospirillum parvum]SDG76620.1 Uncharacterized membrane protein [Roseospirillum parvum]